MQDFLQKHGWAFVETIPGDVSPRRYSRVQKNGHSGILMDCRGAPLDRPGLAEFLKIGTWLRDIGLNTPKIYEVDEAGQLAVLEDFGDISFGKALDSAADDTYLYGLAVDVLAHLKTQVPPVDLGLPGYHDTRIHDLRRDVIDTWLPAVRGQDNPPGLADEFLSIWDHIESGLPPIAHGFLHMDYHLENLMFLPERKGLARCGIIDFQDASIGPAPYDWANLLENVRRTVPVSIKESVLSGYNEGFMLWYRMLAMQWHGRVLGLFTRLARQEQRPGYLVHMPRIYGYMAESMDHSVLWPLRSFFSDLGIDFTNINDLNMQQ